MSNSILLVFAAMMGTAAYMFFVGWFVGYRRGISDQATPRSRRR
jgi:hypothetical protein